MSRNVPYHVDYNMIKSLNKFANLFLYLAAFISLVRILIDSEIIPVQNAQIAINLTSVLSISSVLYYIMDVFQGYLFQQAELNRKNDFIDNSLKTDLADKNSEGYFSNDNLDAGYFKLGVNGFENSLFTKSILWVMMPRMIFKCLVLLVLYLSIALFTDQSTLSTILQVALPFAILQKTIRMTVFYYQVKNVFNQFKNVFSSTVEHKRDSLLINNVINYESAIAWAGILLDDKVFNKLNPELSQEWEKLKKRYNINQ